MNLQKINLILRVQLDKNKHQTKNSLRCMRKNQIKKNRLKGKSLKERINKIMKGNLSKR